VGRVGEAQGRGGMDCEGKGGREGGGGRGGGWDGVTRWRRREGGREGATCH